MEVLEPLHTQHGGPIQSCYYADARVFNQFYNVGHSKLEESILGPGLVRSKSKMMRVGAKSVSRNLIESLTLTHSWWPHDWSRQPFGPGTRTYEDLEIVELLYDLEDYSDFTKPFDELAVLSGQPMTGEIIEGNIVNTVAPAGLLGELYREPGDMYTYCMSTGVKQ